MQDILSPTVIVFYLASILTISHALQLQLASVLFRHGDRSPTHTYPKDQYQESFWPQGFGQLSIEGMRQEYFLGEILRKRYMETEFMYPNYTRVQVYVRSTDYDRTLMSAEALLSALFPPGVNQTFNSSVLWQPIPVHTTPKEDDDLLLAYAADCPVYQKLLEEATKTQAYMDLENENKVFFENLEEDTGFEAVNLTNVHTIRDVLYIEQNYNLTLPGWVNSSVINRLLNLTLYTSSLRFNSQKKQQLTAGNWVGQVVDDMMMKKENPEEEIKLYLYSAHDSTVEATMTALGVFNGELPPYAAAFFIELYSDDDREYWVSLFYRNETDNVTLWPLNVDSCSNTLLCTLEEFEKFTAPLVPADWKKECGLNSDNSTSSNAAVVVLGILLGLSVLLLVGVSVVGVVMMFRSKRQRYTYSKLTNVEKVL